MVLNHVESHVRKLIYSCFLSLFPSLHLIIAEGGESLMVLKQRLLRSLCNKERRSHIQSLEGRSIWLERNC